MAIDRYAVIGHPVAHSKSPLIHSQFARQTGQDLSYEAIDVEEHELAAFVTGFFADGGCGLNVTVPHKQAAYDLSVSCSERARLAAAVNTLKLDSAGQLYGDNTDGVGLLRDLTANLGFSLSGKSLLMLGAGGAARGALATLISEPLASIAVANRTPERAEALSEDFSQVGVFEVLSFAELDARPFDLIINATSAGLDGELPAVTADMLAADCLCYDMLYADSPTPFVAWARQQGALAADGLGMLVEQAAESFYLWRGLRPDTAAVIESLRPAA